MLLPDLWREPLGPDPDGVRVLLLVGTGIFDELGCLAFNNPGGPEIEVFLELGLELLLVLDKYYKELGTCICNEY